MLGSQVVSDFELSSIAPQLPTCTSWGRERFLSGLQTCTSEWKEIKQRQLPLLVFKTQPEFRASARTLLQTIQTSVVDDCLQNNDPRIQEHITQIFWQKKSMGSFLNTSPLVLNSLCIWKTICLPILAILMPICMVLVPFFIQRIICPEQEFQDHVSDYLSTFRSALLAHMRIPEFLKAKHSEDRIGFLFESLFLALALTMFVSSIWNQISLSLHLRRIWFDIERRGKELRNLRFVVQSIVAQLQSLPKRVQSGVRTLREQGESILEQTASYTGYDNVTTFGSFWNDSTHLQSCKEWIAHVDVLLSIASLPNICFPKARTQLGIELVQAYHPNIQPCVPNNLSLRSHCIVTGPNRGGKSTFCKTVGLSILTAQSWGFAFAKRMTWSPFHCMYSALEPCGKLGISSTFEAEIEFAKTVLALPKKPTFIMMDEIFHSTNANDGIIASKVFLDRLYKQPHILSVVSTHYTELAYHYTDTVVPLQLVTNGTNKQSLTYTYKVAEGVSEVSSVMDILTERGLAL